MKVKLESRLRMPVRMQLDLPVAWLVRASGLPGKSLHVAMCLLYLSQLRRSPCVRTSQAVYRRFGVSRDASYDALTRLESAGLVRVTRSPGRTPDVRLLIQASAA